MDPSPDFDAYDAKMAAMARLEAEVLPLNKAALFAALAAAGIAKVVIHFSGYGDSGQLDSICAFDAAEKVIDLPTTTVELKTVTFSEPAVTARHTPVAEVLETLTYKLLEHTHGGWENDDGADADFIIDVVEGKITLNYDEHYRASNRDTNIF